MKDGSRSVSASVDASRVFLLLAVIGCVCIFLLEVFGVPIFVATFSEFGVKLPRATALAISPVARCVGAAGAALVALLLVVKEKALPRRQIRLGLNGLAFVLVGVVLFGLVATMFLPVWLMDERLNVMRGQVFTVLF